MIISRRSILGTAAAGVVTAATANAQTSDIPQPKRPGKGGTDVGPCDVIRDRENPDVLVPPVMDSATLPNLKSSFADAQNETAPPHQRITALASCRPGADDPPLRRHTPRIHTSPRLRETPNWAMRRPAIHAQGDLRSLGGEITP
jgi:hypothetical protein